MNITYREKDSGIQAIVSYKKNNKWRQKSKQGFSTKKDAKRWAEKTMFELQEDIRDNIDNGEITLSQLIELYLEYLEGHRKESTIITAKAELASFKTKAEHLLERSINTIKPFEITNIFLKNRKETGKSYHALNTRITALFRFAVKELRAIRDNPCTRLPSISEDQRILYVDDELYQKILASIDHRPDWQLFLRLLRETGIRRLEAFGLTLDRIFPDRIKIDRQWQRGTFTTCKTTNSVREVPIKPELYRALKDVKTNDIHGRIFLFSESALRLHLSNFRVSFHCFRHTFATDLVAMGINLKAASDILGDTMDTFIKTYVESSTAEKEKAFELIRNA